MTPDGDDKRTMEPAASVGASCCGENCTAKRVSFVRAMLTDSIRGGVDGAPMAAREEARVAARVAARVPARVAALEARTASPESGSNWAP